MDSKKSYFSNYFRTTYNSQTKIEKLEITLHYCFIHNSYLIAICFITTFQVHFYNIWSYAYTYRKILSLFIIILSLKKKWISERQNTSRTHSLQFTINYIKIEIYLKRSTKSPQISYLKHSLLFYPVQLSYYIKISLLLTFQILIFQIWLIKISKMQKQTQKFIFIKRIK